MAETRFRIRTVILWLLLLAHVVYAAAINQPGHYTVDEGAYHLMVKAFVEEGSLAVDNGYSETPSEELVYAMLRPDDRDPSAPRLVPQYPSIYAVFAAPFYWLAGFQGLFVLNLLAFFGTVWATMSIARRLYGDPAIPLNAALMLILGTYVWEYAQGVWPHMLSMFFVSGAVLAALAALQDERPGPAAARMALAGLVVGIGAGVRYDVVLVIPALALPFLFAARPRLLPVLAMAVATAPGLVALALSNQAKFGVLSPFSYGGDVGAAVTIGSYLPLLGAGLGGLVLAWLATRPSVLRTIDAHRSWALGVAAVLALALALLPETRDLLVRLFRGSWELVVDLRFRPDIEEWGVSRTPTGGLAYGDWLKRALLQSCPWLVAIGLPLGRWLRRRDGATAMLLLAIGAYVTIYGYQRWHGGMSMNMRYFLPLLPFAAILGAEAWQALGAELTDRRRKILAAAGLGSAAVWVPLILSDPTLGIEPVLLGMPLLIATALAVFLLLRLSPAPRIASLADGGGFLLIAAGFAWAASAALVYDLPRSTFTRAVNHRVGMEARAVVGPDPIVFARYANRVSVLIADGVPLAFPRNDDFADFGRLLNWNIDAGRNVYLAFNDEYWDEAADRGLLEGLDILPLFEEADIRFAEARRR